MIALATSHGPTSTPLRTSDRGAGTRQAPYAQASHISSQLASKATDRPAITRSPGPMGSSTRNIRDSASTKAAALRWVTATPLGLPVEPLVKMTQASSVGRRARPRLEARRPVRQLRGDPALDPQVVADHRDRVGLLEHDARALVGVVGVDGDVGRAGAEDAEDGDVEIGGAGLDAHADLVADPDTDLVQLGRDLVGGLGELGVGQHRDAAVDRGALRGELDDLAEDVDQGAGRGRAVTREELGQGGRHGWHCEAPE